MTKSRFTEHQIISILKQTENGRTVAKVCRGNSISSSTYLKWKNKGKLTKISSATSETRYTAFDTLGRITASEQRTPVDANETIATATPRAMSYVYNLSGALLEETYPSTRVVKNVRRKRRFGDCSK